MGFVCFDGRSFDVLADRLFWYAVFSCLGAVSLCIAVVLSTIPPRAGDLAAADCNICSVSSSPSLFIAAACEMDSISWSWFGIVVVGLVLCSCSCHRRLVTVAVGDDFSRGTRIGMGRL